MNSQAVANADTGSNALLVIGRSSQGFRPVFRLKGLAAQGLINVAQWGLCRNQPGPLDRRQRAQTGGAAVVRSGRFRTGGP